MSTSPTADPASQTVELAYGPVHVVSAGSGPPLLLLHHDVGPMGWTEFHEALVRDFTVFAPDMPGFGESPRADWARHPRDLAAVMLALARNLGRRHYTLVGLGFGGWVAAEMAAFAYPEMAALVLAAPAGLKPESSFILDQVMEEHFAYLRAGFANPETFEKHFPDARDKAVKTRLDGARETIARVSWKPYMYSYELPETLREVHLPVTVVWGDRDAVVPQECARLFADAIPACRVEYLPGAGHFLDREAPQELARIVSRATGEG
jgi:pimeloyl-ACP methyl ester carboxylesterase